MRLSDADAGRWAAAALLRLIAAPSPSGREHPAVDEAERLAVELGLPVRRMPVAGCADNLLIGEQGPPALLLNAHTDTVTPSWPPESPRLEGGRVRGLGAVDDKGQIVTFLLALQIAGPVPGVALGLTVDEEDVGRGSRAMAAALRPPRVLVGEGTGLRIAEAECGHVEGTIRFHGTAVHGAYAEPRGNPIHDAARLLAGLDAEPLAPPDLVKVVAREIQGGGEMNVSPAGVRMELHAKVLPGADAGGFAAALERRVAATGGEVAFVEVIEAFAPRAPSPLAALLAAEVGAGAERLLMPAWTDAHNFVEVSGSDVVVFGPGSLLDAHRPGESIAVDEMVQAARAIGRMIEDTEVAV